MQQFFLDENVLTVNDLVRRVLARIREYLCGHHYSMPRIVERYSEYSYVIDILDPVEVNVALGAPGL